MSLSTSILHLYRFLADLASIPAFETVPRLSTKMDYDALVTFVQKHFTDGLALVIGSGLSAAEGIPGMSALATHLSNGAGLLTKTDATLWYQIKAVLDAGGGLEAALLEHRHPTRLRSGSHKGRANC